MLKSRGIWRASLAAHVSFSDLIVLFLCVLIVVSLRAFHQAKHHSQEAGVAEAARKS